VLHLTEWSDYRAIDPVALADIVARGEANVWPAALRGTGFYEKVQTDHVLRDLICRRAISLMQAQHDLERNWNAAWLTYVVAGDHP
jgi:hypothetical protein